MTSVIKVDNIQSSGGTAALEIDSSGRVTLPSVPAFHMENTTSGSAWKGGNVRANVGSHYNNTTGVFTAPVAGTYHFTLHGQSTNSSGYYSAAIFVNDVAKAAWYDDTGGSIYKHAACALTITLSANDEVKAEIQSSSVATNTGGQNGFGGFLIG